MTPPRPHTPRRPHTPARDARRGRGHVSRPARLVVLLAVLAMVAAACGDDAADGGTATGSEEVTIRLLTHDSFSLPDEVLTDFTDRTGIRVELLRGGDAGTVVNQAILTRDNPQADVLFGVDSTFLTRALDADLFLPHESEHLDAVPAELQLDERHRVTPVDYGDVCVNYDVTALEAAGIEPPSDLEALAEPAYRDLLVVENPATSSPGLSFLLATIARFGEEGWEDYWEDLRANGVEVADGWEAAYYGSFSGGSGSEGDKPLVVSYATSPAAEVIFADPPVEEAPTGVLEDGCYRQVEFAGVLAGTDHREEAGAVVDLLLSPEAQAEIPLAMFVFPARDDVEVGEAFLEHSATPAAPLVLDAADVEANREAWIRRWTEIVLG